MQNKTIEIILVDDDTSVRNALSLVLMNRYTVSSFSGPREAAMLLEKRHIPLVLLDLNLPDCNGLEILKAWKQKYPQTEIIFCSGETRVEKAIECLRFGASDFVVKPFKKEDLLFIIERTLEKYHLKKRSEQLDTLVSPRPVEFIGESQVIQELLSKVQLLKKQTHLNVILLGESGTGKEIMARLLHQQEPEKDRPFVTVNMPAIPSNLMEAELFGVEKGAYTDAKQARAGKFELADGGDIFLDEIGDLPLDTQAKLLRTLQEKLVQRVGSNKNQKVNFRVISATNQPLSELMSTGHFREDVIYRLSDMVLWLPPLRDRRDDIPLLAKHFIQKYSRVAPAPTLSAEALQVLLDYHWPGNVRQLESTLKRALIFCTGPVIEKIEIYDPTMFNPRQMAMSSSKTAVTDSGLEESLLDFEKKMLESALSKYKGDSNAVMAALKLSRATFYRKLTQFNISR